MADSSNMICPSCQTFQPKAEICSSCGVIISKVQDAESNKVQRPTEKQASKASAMKIPAIILVSAVVKRKHHLLSVYLKIYVGNVYKI